ncbi:unnamed protein product [Adineta ricciae]|uniref:Uncharacterized protein n=1 Tax=Adineta ricciae TaxID=249248 RepID=A0A816E7J7_ADIRI|nr:unnamed protein product [Adineta ricciae]
MAMLRFIVVITLAIPLLAIILGSIENAQYTSLPKPKYLGPIQSGAPSSTSAFGRYTKPFSVIDYSWVSSSKFFDFFNLKHWDFKSISTERYFIVAAIANFNYISAAFVYVIDRSSDDKPVYQYSTRSILAQALKEQAKSSIEGCTHFFRSSAEYIRLCYNKSTKMYVVDANVPMGDGVQVSFDFTIDYSSEKDESMVLLYPVLQTRPAYTHKIAGLPSRGHIQFGNEKNKQELSNGLSSLDWTLAYSERSSHWKWISLSTVAIDSSNDESVTIGINLSDIVYNDENGVSMESAVWIAGKVYKVNLIAYELPEKQYLTSDSWQVYSSGSIDPNAPNIRLTFQPHGSQEEHINLFILDADFVQASGTYNGTIELAGRRYIIENGFGVAENHYAKW